MNLLNPFLTIKRSLFPGCGKGLFTKIFIPKGMIITEHTGKISSFKDADDEGNNPYLFYVNRNLVIDAREEPGSFARFANDALGYKRMEGFANNAKYIIMNKRVFITAIKDILPKEEIFVGYGKEYWDVMKENKIFEMKQA